MKRKILLCLCLVLVSPGMARPSDSEQKTKELSGMSIVGNDEAPKSLYIVPWKSSQVGVETSMSMLLNKKDVPVDRDVFQRQLDFYEVSRSNKSGRTR